MFFSFQACLLDKLDDNAVEVSAVVCIMGAVEPHYATDNVTPIDTIKNKKNKILLFSVHGCA